MTSSQLFLSSILNTAQLTQKKLNLGMKAAASHSLKSAFKKQLLEFDQIESEIQSAASRRGWDLSELQPGMLWIRSIRFQWRLRRSKTDSGITELMIRHSTNDMIDTLKTAHELNVQDVQILTILQKLLDCQTVVIRQLQSFL